MTEYATHDTTLNVPKRSIYLDTETAFVQVLRENTTDPLGRGERKNWIYSGSSPPGGARKIKIHVSRIPDNNPTRRVGSHDQDYELEYQVLVQVPIGSSGTLDGTVYRGEDLVNQICDSVASTVEDNAGSVTGVKKMMRSDTGEYYVNSESKCLVCPMTFQLTVENT